MPPGPLEGATPWSPMHNIGAGPLDQWCLLDLLGGGAWALDRVGGCGTSLPPAGHKADGTLIGPSLAGAHSCRAVASPEPGASLCSCVHLFPAPGFPALAPALARMLLYLGVAMRCLCPLVPSRFLRPSAIAPSGRPKMFQNSLPSIASISPIPSRLAAFN